MCSDGHWYGSMSSRSQLLRNHIPLGKKRHLLIYLLRKKNKYDPVKKRYWDAWTLNVLFENNPKIIKSVVKKLTVAVQIGCSDAC